MARETTADKAKRALEIIERLDRQMPEANIELNYKTPLELLVAVILSAQTTDKGVNKATPALFAKYRNPADYAVATPQEIEVFIKTLGLFRNKAKSLVALGKALLEHHGGQVPGKRSEIAQLPGAGLKTAGVVSMHLGTDVAFPVDTHIMRLANRMGFTTADNPDDVEDAMRKLVPQKWWFKAHQLIIWHGRRVCDAKAPKCFDCVVSPLCPRRGVPKKFMQAPEFREK